MVKLNRPADSSTTHGKWVDSFIHRLQTKARATLLQFSLFLPTSNPPAGWKLEEREKKKRDPVPLPCRLQLNDPPTAVGGITCNDSSEAIAEAALARELDPLALLTRTHESLFLYYDGRYEEAKEKLSKTLELDPNFWIALLTLAKIHIRQGEYAEAIAELSKARRTSGGNAQTISLIGYAWAM